MKYNFTKIERVMPVKNDTFVTVSTGSMLLVNINAANLILKQGTTFEVLVDKKAQAVKIVPTKDARKFNYFSRNHRGSGYIAVEVGQYLKRGRYYLKDAKELVFIKK